ncbi:hypothetical protein ACFL2B_00985 [Patescibacteria group bacterium]
MNKLLAIGVKGTAKILELEDTGVFINKQPLMSTKLEINIAGHDPYVVNKKKVVPFSRINLFQVGNTVNIVVDPNDHTNPRKVEVLF